MEIGDPEKIVHAEPIETPAAPAEPAVEPAEAPVQVPERETADV